MTYFSNLSIEASDTYSIDAFGRWRTSDSSQRLDCEFIYNKQAEYFDEVTNNGTVTFNSNTRDLTLSLSDAVDGSYAEMASYPVPYTPGNSQLINLTAALDLASIGGGNAEFFLRSKISGSVTEQVVPESSWNVDTSSINWGLSHIYAIDFQSLKVGIIRFGVYQGGIDVQLGSLTQDDLRGSGYWELPNLPVYYKIYNDATYTYMEVGYGNADNAVGFRYKITANASATMKAICCTVKSEGGPNIYDLTGLPRSVDSGVTVKTISTTLVPLISIRPKTTFASFDNLILSIPKAVTILTDESIKLVMIHQASLTGAAWVDVDTSKSSVEYDITATALSGGHVIYNEYLYATSGGGKGAVSVSNSKQGILGKSVLWNRKGSETGIFTVAAVRAGNADADILAGIRWEEIR